MVTLSAILQAPVQALIKPSMWLPCIHRLHSCKETWKTDCNLKEFREAVISTVYKIIASQESTEFWDFHEVREDGTFFRIFTFTRAEWLDVIEIKYIEGHYEVCSYSSGVLPLIIPFACILNIVFFFVPFLDQGLNQRRLQRLKDALSIPVHMV
ncbi:hypothetical protein ACF0H5_016727 [Mactra antiquata]